MKRGSAMIGTLITVAIILILLVVFMKGGCGSIMMQGGSPRADGKGTTVPGLVKAEAQDDVCRENLSQIRQMIQVREADADDKPPASLSEINAPDSLLHCPIGHEAYIYDPQTGTVKCPHPGHGKY
ncbi:MAG TPA: hypothetical protein VKT78_12725 [Fimbriimonadaceae bacterium]|nr:hypothetical protein [Fimbriimonadaceae bacterium]